MFLKNEKGELVNINKIAAVKTETNARNLYGEIRHHIDMHTEHSEGVRFSYKTVDEFTRNYKAIQELLIKGPKYNQRPWVDANAKWVCANGSMIRLDQIECIVFEGWIVTIHMTNSEMEFCYNSDDELNKCLNNFEFNLRSIGHLINLSGWKAEE